MPATDDRIRELGLELPDPPAPGGSYVPVVVAGGLAFVAGQIPARNGRILHRGKVGAGVGEEEAREAAALCALNVLAALRAALGGDLDRVRRCVKLGVFVNCAGEFDRHPEVANGASETMMQVLGDRGPHARFAVGAPSLPRNVTVEVDAVFEID